MKRKKLMDIDVQTHAKQDYIKALKGAAQYVVDNAEKILDDMDNERIFEIEFKANIIPGNVSTIVVKKEIYLEGGTD